MTSAPSQSSQELSDSEIPSAIGPCIEDDKEFIRNARQRTMANDAERMIKGGGRVALLWWALRYFPSSLRQRVFLELLEGSDDGEDVWLWNEGDEALMEWDKRWWDSPPPWTSAAAALERRLARTPPQTLRRREVESAAFEMRAAMIGWLAFTSAVYKRADEECGWRDREEWFMGESIADWSYSLPNRLRQWLTQQSESYDHQPFTKTMDQAGHSCHQETEEWVTWWLFMRSQLFPTQQDSIIYFGDDHCAPCFAHKPIPGSESPPSWTPSHALVALRFIWDNIAHRRDFSKWLSDQPIYRLTEVNDLFNSLPRDTDEDQYPSWVNAYPRRLRDTVTQYTLEEWQAIDSCIQPSECSGSLNIRSWCAAMFWRMMPRELSYHARVERFIEVWRYSVLLLLDFLLPPTPAPEFRDAIRVSGHTCWLEWEMDDYAAAMAVLEEDLKVVGIDVQEDLRCQVCRLQWRLKSLSENLPMEERAFEADLTELEDLLRKERSRRKIVQDGILVPVQQHSVLGPTSNSGHQEQQDPHHTLYDHDEQRHEMSTDHLNAPYHPQPPIPQVRHLSERIRNISHQDINTPYVQHNSTGSRHDDHATTLIAEPITNGIQDQDNGVQYPPFHEIQPPSYTNSTRSGAGNYTAYGQPWVLDDQLMVQDTEALQTQVPGRRSTPLAMLELVNPSVENDITSWRRDTFIEGATMRQDNPATASVQQANSERITPSQHNSNTITPSHRSPARQTNVVSQTAKLPPKGQMRDEVKKFLTDAMEQHGVQLQYKGNEPKLPWLDFQKTLKDHKITMINWPVGLEQPGKGLSDDPRKGIAGLNIQDLRKIYRAIHDRTAPLQLIRDGPGENTAMYRMPDEQREVGSSRKRPRGDSDDEMSRPPKRYDTLIMRL